MTLTKSPYICNPDILFCHEARSTRSVALDFGDADMLPAGTLISCEGKAVNDLTALGVLLYDTWKGYGSDKGVVLISGHVDLAKAQENCGQTYSAEAKAALKGIVFVGDTCCSVVVGESTVKGGTLTWTGNMEGAIDFSFMGAGTYLVKLSDTVPTLEELANGGSGVGLEGVEEFTHYAVDEGLLFGPESGLLIAINENWGNPDHAFNLPLIVPTEINFEGMIIIPKGVYTFYGNGVAQCTSFTLNNYTGFETTEVQTIDPKYLPVNYIKQLIAEVTGN